MSGYPRVTFSNASLGIWVGWWVVKRSGWWKQVLEKMIPISNRRRLLDNPVRINVSFVLKLPRVG